MPPDPTYVILGAGVVGLTTALELQARRLDSRIIIVAKYLPGDRSIDYCSPWAGANWLSSATDNGLQEQWDAVTYLRLKELSKQTSQNGVHAMEIRAVFDSPPAEAGVLSTGTGRIWYEDLVGGLRYLEKGDLPDGAVFGFDLDTFVIDTQTYLPWLQNEALRKRIEIRRKMYTDINEMYKDFPTAQAYFNCTGIGSHSLKGVEDRLVYPQRGQVLLVENPKHDASKPLTRMYFRSPKRTFKDTTYVFPRGRHGGVILGGCRFDNEWSGDVDLEFSEDIKRRCCALAPELGKAQDLKVIQHAVGLRPCRKGGARIERELVQGNRLLIHNYGAGGTGYQASWGMAKQAVDLLPEQAKL